MNHKEYNYFCCCKVRKYRLSKYNNNKYLNQYYQNVRIYIIRNSIITIPKSKEQFVLYIKITMMEHLEKQKYTLLETNKFR